MNNDFRRRLIEVRNAYGLSGYAFAKKLNIPQPTYLRYETGEQKPSSKLLEALAITCNVNVYWLFTGDGKMFFNPEDNSGERQFDQTISQRFKNFGKRLSELQAQHNFLDREMAKLLGITERQYISIVTGSRQPTMDVLNHLKENFRVSLDYMLYDL